MAFLAPIIGAVAGSLGTIGTVLSIGATIGGAVLGMTGANKSAKAAERAAAQQKQVAAQVAATQQALSNRQADLIAAQAAEQNKQAALTQQTAGQERAASQVAAINQRIQGRYAQSGLRSALSATGALDPTFSLQGALGNEDDYRVASALFEGESAARKYENDAALMRGQAGLTSLEADLTRQGGASQAEITRLTGDLNATKLSNDAASYRNQGYSSLLSGVSRVEDTLYNKYAKPAGPLYT